MGTGLCCAPPTCIVHHQAALSVLVSVCICGTYVVHHFNGTARATLCTIDLIRYYTNFDDPTRLSTHNAWLTYKLVKVLKVGQILVDQQLTGPCPWKSLLRERGFPFTNNKGIPVDRFSLASQQGISNMGKGQSWPCSLTKNLLECIRDCFLPHHSPPDHFQLSYWSIPYLYFTSVFLWYQWCVNLNPDLDSNPESRLFELDSDSDSDLLISKPTNFKWFQTKPADWGFHTMCQGCELGGFGFRFEMPGFEHHCLVLQHYCYGSPLPLQKKRGAPDICDTRIR